MASTRRRLVSTEHVEEHYMTTARTTYQPSKTTLIRLQSEDGSTNKGWCFPERSLATVVFKLLVATMAGVVFGWSLEKGRVFEPAQIRLQMVFQRFVMLKMFLSATAVGQLVMALLSVLPGANDRFNRAKDGYACVLGVKGLLTSSVGPFLLGAGMTLSGSCPGMVLAQVGSQAYNSGYTLLGALSAALLYGLLAGPIVRLTKPSQPLKCHSVDQSKGFAYIMMAVPMALMLLGVVYMVEQFAPWEQDLDCWNRNSIATPNATSMWSQKSWPPYISGSLIGLLQLPIILFFADTVGGSNSFSTVVSQWVVTEKLQEMFPYLAGARCGLANWWQVFFVGAVIAGSAASSTLSDSVGTAQGVSVNSALAGGFLILFGARLAGGCTSGHGLSGMGMLYWLSFIAVPAMFAGAISLAVFMNMSGTLMDLQCPEGGAGCPSIPSMQC